MPLSGRDVILRIERKVDRYLGPPLVGLLSLLPSRRSRAQDSDVPRRILLIKLHGIGNIVLLLPVIRRLRSGFPEAEIDFLSFRSNAGILEGLEEITARHYLDRGSPWRLFRSTVRTFRRIRGRAYDLVIDFDQFAHFSSIATLVTGAPERIGFRNPTLRRHWAYTMPVVYLDMSHVSRTFSRLAETAGAVGDPVVSRRLPVHPRDREELAGFFRKVGIRAGEDLAVLHPGSSENLTLRRWPADRFSGLGDRIAGELGFRIVISGGAGETRLAETVRRGMRHPAVNAAGMLPLSGFAALCESARFVVSNDTAAVHVASAMGTPVVGLFGPNTPFLYGPLGSDDLVYYRDLPCSPCLCNLTSKMSSCRRARCMEEITVDAVFEGIRARYYGNFPHRRPGRAVFAGSSAGRPAIPTSMGAGP
ncbi:MAG: glycosyltransferase family 9 protein [Deltaproteobacteria bacterium]